MYSHILIFEETLTNVPNTGGTEQLENTKDKEDCSTPLIKVLV
jgi:hypothetical protein